MIKKNVMGYARVARVNQGYALAGFAAQIDFISAPN